MLGIKTQAFTWLVKKVKVPKPYMEQRGKPLWFRADIRDYGRRQGLIPQAGRLPTVKEVGEDFWRVMIPGLSSCDDGRPGFHHCTACGHLAIDGAWCFACLTPCDDSSEPTENP